MPKKDGFDVMRAMEQRKLSSAVVFLTMHNDEEFFNGAMNLGARGYVLKESAFSELVDGIKAVAAGRHFVSPSLSTYLLSLWFARNASVAISLCCSAFITVMQTAKLRDCDDSSDTRDLAR